MEQAKTHGDYSPVVFHMKNRTDLHITMKAKDFFKFLVEEGLGGSDAE